LMIGLGAIAKLASSGGMDPAALTKLLKAFGIEVTWQSLETGDQVRAEFGEMASSAAAAGARFLSIQGETRGGEKLRALLIVRI